MRGLIFPSTPHVDKVHQRIFVPDEPAGHLQVSIISWPFFHENITLQEQGHPL